MYAQVSDLEARWRTLTPGEQSRAAVLLQDAAVRLDVECPPDEDVSDADARLIVSVEMVKRAMAAAVDDVGVSSVQVGAGPYQQTRQFANPTGDLYVSKSDRRLLRCGSQRAFTVSLVGDGS